MEGGLYGGGAYTPEYTVHQVLHSNNSVNKLLYFSIGYKMSKGSCLEWWMRLSPEQSPRKNDVTI